MLWIHICWSAEERKEKNVLKYLFFFGYNSLIVVFAYTSQEELDIIHGDYATHMNVK